MRPSLASSRTPPSASPTCLFIPLRRALAGLQLTLPLGLPPHYSRGFPGIPEDALGNHNVRLDLQLSWPAVGRHLAIELKYMTRLWAGEVGGEPFALKRHGAQDVRCYDVVKDVERVERFVERKPGWSGYA
jgi:hypothetical protein